MLLLAVATVFLIRSMSKRIRRLPASFDPPEERRSRQPEDAAGPAAATPSDADDAGRGRA